MAAVSSAVPAILSTISAILSNGSEPATSSVKVEMLKE